MVVADFNIIGLAVLEQKADSPLVVDGNRMLPLAVASKRMQPIARWNPEVAESGRRVYLFKLSQGPLHNVRREPTCLAGHEQVLRSLVCKGLDHA